MNFTISVDENQIKQDMLLAIGAHLDRAMRGAASILPFLIKPLIFISIENTPEYQSLLSGRLLADFGIQNPDVVLTAIKDAVYSGLEVLYDRVTTSGDTIVGGLTIQFLRSDFSDVLPTERLAGTPIPWLQWLLTAGDSIVISNYTVSYDTNGANSRTGQAFMIQSDVGYRVPPEFSGTSTNNWLTRAFDNIDDELTRIVQFEIERRL